MCWKTEAGLVQSVAEIRMETPNDLPPLFQDFRYVIFKEEDDMLGLKYHAVCIDLEVDSRGTTPAQAYEGLKNSVCSFIDVTLKYANDKSKAYDALKEQIENRCETRELVYRAYNEVLAHNATVFYAKLRPHYTHLYDSVSLKPQEVISSLEYKNFYSSAYSEEEIEKLYKPKKLPDDKIINIFAVYYYLWLRNIKWQSQKLVGQKIAA